jgi:hypothetical protein
MKFDELIGGGAKNTFKCQGCGNCCRMPGYVRVSESEIARIAKFLEQVPEEFREQWTAPTHDGDRTLLENADGACAYLDRDNTCMINPVKPLQCRDFPEHWRYDNLEAVCPAARRD